MCDQGSAMSAAKDSTEVPRKPTSEAKRIIQNDQEKQRKEKIKTCIGEIAKELPPSSDHIDRKPSTLSIVSQAKEYIKKLKEQNKAHEGSVMVDEQQEELKRLRQAQAEHLEKIKKLEETLKTYALEKVIKSSEDNGPACSGDRKSPTNCKRSKGTINKLLAKERNEQLQISHPELHPLDPSMPLLGSGLGHHSNSSAVGSGGNNNSTLPPSSIVLPVSSSSISIMTVAPTILSVKSPSLGQSRNQQTSRSISSSSVVGSSTSSRISSSSSSSSGLVSYLDIMGNDFTGVGASSEAAQTNLVFSTSSISSASSTSMLTSGSGSMINSSDIVSLQQLQNNTTGGSSAGGNSNSSSSGASGMMGNLQGSDLSLLHHHQQQGVAPMMGLNQQQEAPGSASALQTLASVATSTHMANLTGVSLANNQPVGSAGSIMGLPVGLGGGLSTVSMGQLTQQQPSPIMALSQSDSSTNLAQDRKQVLFNGQILTLTDQGLISGQQQGEADCQTNLQANNICPQPNLPLAGSTNLQQGGVNTGILGQSNFPGGPLASGPLGQTGPNQPIIYTINEQGQLVPLQNSVNTINPPSSGLDLMVGNTGNIITNFQAPHGGGSGLIPSSIQHQQPSNILGQPPIVSISGGQGPNQPLTILPPGGNPLQPQVVPTSSFLMPQQLPNQQQVLNLPGLGGLQVVNPFTGMIVNNMGMTLNGAPVKVVGNELKLVQPGDTTGPAQGPTHVFVDGSLIPISTNPQTIVPGAAPLSTVSHKTQQLPLAGNPILQFDPNNPSAPPIFINGPATTFQMGPQMLGPNPLYSPALSAAAPGILQVGSGAPLGSSTPFQLNSNGGLVVASSVVASTVTTNSVSACISSPSVSKGGKGLPALAPALSQTSPTIGTAVVSSGGYQTILPSGLSQQFIINGQKVVTAKLNTSTASVSKSSSHNRKRSPSAARSSPVAAAEVAPHFMQQPQQPLLASPGAAVVVPIQQSATKHSVASEKASKSKTSKHNNNNNSNNNQQQQQQQQEDKATALMQKTDLLAQATATAGILMDGEGTGSDFAQQVSSAEENGTLNISTGSNMNLSGSSTELQINLKQSPCDEEDDNVQLIIDENCTSGVSSTSPAHSSFSPNMTLGSTLSVSTSSAVFNHDISLSSGGPQHHPLHIQPSSGDLSTPLVSPNINTVTVTSSQHQKLPPNSAINSMSTSQLLSPLPPNIFTTSSAPGILNATTTSELQMVAGPFRPEDVLAQLSGAMNADTKLNVSPESKSKVNNLSPSNSVGNPSSFSGSVSQPLSIGTATSTSLIKSYIPIAPAPIKVSTISTALTFGHEPQALTFADAMNHANLIPDKPTAKSKSRSKPSTPMTAAVTAVQANKADVSTTIAQTLQPEPKKKPAPKKRKTKAELRQEKEERERLAKEEEERKKKAEEEEKRKNNQGDKEKSGSVEEEGLLPVLEMNENDAVKEQILHTVSESKLLNTDGSQISLMDMVDKIEIFNPAEGSDNVFPNSGGSVASVTDLDKSEASSASGQDKAEKQDKNDSKTTKREPSRRRKNDTGVNAAPKPDAKRSKKGKPADPPKQVTEATAPSLASLPVGGNTSSDIYDFVDDEDSSINLLQPPPTPAKSPTKKTSNARKGKASKASAADMAVSGAEAKTSSSVTTRSEAKNGNKTTAANRQPANTALDSVVSTALSKIPASTTASSVSLLISVTETTTSCGPVTLSSPMSSSSLLTMPATPKSPPLFASTPSKSGTVSLPLSSASTALPAAAPTTTASPNGAAATISATTSAMDNNTCNANTVSSCMSKKDTADATLHSTLEESFSMEFPVMDFQSSPKLSEAHDDQDNSIGLPADPLADLFHSPGKMNFNSTSPTLQNGVLSPSEVELPALRTPAPPMNHSHSEPVLMLDNPTSKEFISPPSSEKSSLSRMHTPPPLPAGTKSDSITTSPAASSSLTKASSSSGPPLSSSMPSSSNAGNKSSSCMNSAASSLHHLDATSSSPQSAAQLESQMPSLSSTSLDALSEILPLKPITAELEAEVDTTSISCAQQQHRPNPVQTQPLSHVPLSNSDMGMGLPQPSPQHTPQPQQPQTSGHSDLQPKQQQQQQQQQRPNQSHLPPQSSPHNLRPPSASTTPLPSPKLHASPGSASNAGSVHSMSPAAQQQQQQQQQQQHHPCQKQQPNPQMSNNPMMERVGVPPLSHPPQQAPNLSQLFPPPDTSPRNATFTSPTSGSSMKLKHMSPSNAQSNTDQQTSNFINSQKPGNYPQNSNQAQKNQYSVDKIIEHPNNTTTSAASRHPNESFNFTNIGSNVTTAAAIPSSGTMPLTSSGFSFSLSSSSAQHQQQQQQSCSGNNNTNNNNNNNSASSHGAVSSMQATLPPSGTHASHNSSYLHSFFPHPSPMNVPPSSSSHHNLAMHPLGNMEIQHTSSRPSSGGSATYGMGPSSLMTYGNQPKLDIPPIAKSPTYNTNNPPNNANANNSNNKNTNINQGKSPSAGSSNSGGGASYSHTNTKQTMDANNTSRYQGSKSTPESIYQQQQKRPNTIQHPPAGMTHMDPMAQLSSSAHNNSFFPMGFPASSSASLSSASMPLRHLPDSRDIPSRSPYDYPMPHHAGMGFPHAHPQIPTGYGPHPSFARDCARLDAGHHQQQAQQQQQQAQQPQPPPQQQQQQQQQQQPAPAQQSPRKQTAPKKSSSNSSVGSSNNSSNTNSSSNNSSHRSGASNNSGSAGSAMNQGHGHSPAASSNRQAPSQHHNSQPQNTGSSNGSSSSSSSHNRSSSSAQKRKAASSSSSSSKKKSTASQHTGFPEAMDPGMSQNMFESSFSYLNFPTLTQSMSPPAARPHQPDTPFLGGMFNTPARPISNTSAKTADMTASHFPLFPTRAQNSFFQPGGFGMNSMTGNHGNPAAGIAPHSMGVPPHMSAFGLFGNEAAGAPDNISSNKFLHPNSILPGGPHQSMDHSLQHGAHQTAASLYHARPHAAQSHMMAAFYPHGFDSRSHMSQPFNSSMGPPPFHTPGLPPINFSMHDSH